MQPHKKVHRAVQVAEQEFEIILPRLAYTHVLKACSQDNSEEAANFALKIVAGMKVSIPRSTALMAVTPTTPADSLFGR